MSIKGRLDKLEQRAGGPGRVIVLRQSLDDKTLFTDNEGNQYTEGEHWPEGEDLTVVRVVYASNWRGAGEELQVIGRIRPEDWEDI